MQKNLKILGFTIIEVSMVLAIAGVIMVVILSAVPQAQKNQRNNARKTIAQRLVTSLENYNANNQGTYPFNGPSGSTPNLWTSVAADCKQAVAGQTQTCNEWYTNYVLGKIDIKDPSCGSDVNIRYSTVQTGVPGSPDFTSWSCTPTTTTISPGDIFIGVGDQCANNVLAAGQGGVGSTSSKQYAVLVALESSASWACFDNR